MTIAITGGTSGIGFETALQLAGAGHRIIILARDERRGQEVCEALAKSGTLPEFIPVELSSMTSIRQAAGHIASAYPSLDVLINNAGAWYTEFGLTEDGVERGFAINHLAPFLLSHLLLPTLAASGKGRILNLSSNMHFVGKMQFDDLNLSRNYHAARSYAQSKLANVLFTYELDRRLKQHNIRVSTHAVHPGLVRTGIGIKHAGGFDRFAWRLWSIVGISPASGAKTSVFLATHEEGLLKSGLYWNKCKPMTSSRLSRNADDARRLWEISERLCGIDNYFAIS